MELPRGYNKRLQKFDELLRMRWSPSQEVWLLERQYARRNDARVNGTSNVQFIEPFSDSWIQLRDGYMGIGEYPARELPNIDRLINCLRWSDTWNMGMDADAIADYMDVEWVAQRRRASANFRDEVGNRASEAYDTLKWRDGSRAAVPR